MTWSWSHTDEAYANAHANLYDLGRDALEVIWAEWRTSQSGGNDAVDDEPGEDDYWDDDRYNQCLADAQREPTEDLVESIWEWMSEQAICERGGHEAWACPYGCGCHLVSFSRREEVTQ